jgi:2-oxoglutarate dehydrogenase E2 component (dihydrolipoamide succinyltransferase)
MSLQIKVPQVGESITEVTIAEWLKADGDYVEQDEVIAEIESDKASFEITAEKPGTLKIVAQEGDTISIGEVVCEIDESGTAPSGDSDPPKAEEAPAPAAEAPAASAPAPQEASTGYAAGHPSPAASKILSEKGVNPSDVSGSGRDGRITKEDAQNANSAPKAAPAPVKSAPAPKPVMVGGSRETEQKKMSSMRKTIAKRLVSVKNETAMLTTFNEVDMKPIMDIRKKYKEQFKEKHNIGLGFMSFFTKAVCEALKEFPTVNSQIDGDFQVNHDYCDISIAVSSPKGLVVPVIRNAEAMSLAQIEDSVKALALKARDGKITLEEMTGGTFTITNGGIFGSMLSTPIINPPQSAILGMHNIVERPVAINGQVEIRPIMYVALSYDHRIVDGRESVGFLVKVKEYLEDPTRLLLGI